MKSSKLIRKVFDPLSTSTYVKVEGETFQTYNSALGVYSPDRSESGNELTLLPVVQVSTNSKDTSWKNGNYAPTMNFQWYANGTPIEQTPLKDYISIDKSKTATNGQLTIRKNLASSEVYDLVLRGTILDARKNRTFEVATDIVQIGTTELAADEWDLSVVHDTNIKYDPLLDRLKEYDWKVKNGIMQESPTERKKCFDGKQYLKNLPIIISCGTNVINSSHAAWKDLEIRLYVKNQKDGTSIRITPSDNIFVKEIDREHILLDVRFIPDGTVMEVKLYYNGEAMGSEYLTYSLAVGDYSCEPSNEGDLNPEQKYRHDHVTMSSRGRIYEYPDAYLMIKWYTNTSTKSNVEQGTGSKILIDQEKAAIGKADNCWMEVYISTQVKAYAAVLTTDESGNVIVVDEKGNVLTDEVLVG